MDKVKIKISHALKQYGNNVIIPDLSVVIEEGEFFTLLGPSGCGKTTLLRMIAGFNTIEGGDFYFNDQKINDLAPEKRNIGMVFQNYAIFPHLTVKKNVAFGLQNRKLPKDQIEERTQKFLGLMKIEEYQDRLPERLSGGQQQRVALDSMVRGVEDKTPLTVSIRPEEFEIVPEDQEGIGATVEYSTFLGLNTHYFVNLDSGERVEIIQESRIDDILDKGSRIRLQVKKEKINLFTEDGSKSLMR